MARGIGCKSVFVDDGWQKFGDGRWYAGCGDWVPDTAKFPDLRGTVAELSDAGLQTVMWIAPFLVGDQSAAYADLARFASHLLREPAHLGARPAPPRGARAPGRPCALG